MNANFISIVPSSARILYIVPRTGVFTTHTKLNRGLRLRLQRGPELDGDLERELVSPVVAFRVCVVDFCAAAQFYIVSRTGVFTTCTGLNTGVPRGAPEAGLGSPTCVIYQGYPRGARV